MALKAVIGSAICRRLFSTSTSISGEGRDRVFKISRSKAKRKLYRQHLPESNTLTTNRSTSINQNEFEKNSLHRPHDRPWQSSTREIFDSDQPQYVFGIHPVYSALQAEKRAFISLYIRVSLYKQFTDNTITYAESPRMDNDVILDRIWEKVLDSGLPILPVNKSKLDKLASYGVHQGLVLYAEPISIPSWDIKTEVQQGAGERSLWVLIDNVVDPMNLGSLIRTAVYFGVDRILISKSCSKLSPVVSKASSGAMEFATIRFIADVPQLLKNMKELEWDIIGTTCTSTTSTVPSDLSMSRSSLVIVGNEARGIDERILSLCTSLVTVSASQSCPSYIDSLNVSVATGIVLNQLSSLKLKSETN